MIGFFQFGRWDNELLECLDNRVCVCARTHVFRQCDILSFTV